jgi:hypothetical protein
MVTQIVMLAAIALLIIYDFYADFHWGRDETISLHMRDWAKKYPWVPFLIGFLMGHFFWF